MASRTKPGSGPAASGWRNTVAVVAGASSGIGAAVARALCVRGARVALAARRADCLAEVARACPGDAFVVPADVTVEADRRGLVERVTQRWGRIDVFVNCAGIGLYAPFSDTREQDLRALFEVTVFAAFSLTQAVLSVMLPAHRGRIVHVASTGGLVAHASNVCAYLAAKHAVVGMCRGLRRELVDTGVTVQVVCPHLTDTPFFEVGIGAAAMHADAVRLRPGMDSAGAVAEGILDALASDRFVVFPTARARAAYERLAEAV